MVRWGVVLLSLLLIVIRWFWLQSKVPKWNSGQRVYLSFTLRQEPQERFGKQTISYKSLTINIPDNLDIYYGDYIQAFGTVESRLTTNNQAKYTLKTSQIEVVPGKNSLTKQINTLRYFFISRLKKYLPPEEAGLAAGILFGGTQDMTRGQIEAYRRSGLSHVIAASGYNVTLVGAWTVLVLKKIISRKYLMYFVILVIILYAILCGGTASVIRAAVMGIILVVGMIFGRETDIRWVLVLCCLVMLIINPGYLIDIGFQLSVAATGGLIFFKPKSAFWTTITAQIATMPLILHYFGNLSVVAPVANILILWTIPIIMQISAFAVVTGGVLSYLAWPLLKWCNLWTHYFSGFKYSSLTLNPVSWWWVIGYYLVLVIVYKLKFETKN